MSTLIVVPTPHEMNRVREGLRDLAGNPNYSMQRIGLGPIAAAARCGGLISRYRPSRVLLIGIAGVFDAERFPLGTACRFDHVLCDGVGVGRGDAFESASSLGWKQFAADDAMPEVGDSLPLISTYDPAVECAGTLLSVCAASASPRDRAYRHSRYPDAVAEDMEGFSVATVCSLFRVPLQIVRGVSNEVGDRDHAHWQIDQALDSACELASVILRHEWIPCD